MFDEIFDEHTYGEGQTLTDIFACCALIGLVSRGHITNRYEMARAAYLIAHAMWEARKSNEVGV